MKTQTIYVDACTSTGIAIGRRNTYATEQIVFGLAPLVQQYGAGSAVLMVLRPTDTTPYPAVTSQSGTELTWTVSATDTSVPGTGECELYWYVDGGLAKSVIFPLTIQRDIITEPIDEPPEPYQTWVDDLTDLGAETLQNAQAAAQSATDAETAQGLAEDAKTAAETAQGKAETAQGKAETAQEKAETAQTAAEAAADRAEDALEEFTTPTASANTLEPDEEATASYANGHFTFGIPQGVPGDPATNLVQSVNEKTGAVVLDAGDIGYDGETTYPDASVGKELGTINSALSSLSSVTEIIDTASGAIASFPDGSGLPMRSLVAQINPVQAGTGDPSPDNIRPISGHTGLSVEVRGKNLLDCTETGTQEDLTYHVTNVVKAVNKITFQANGTWAVVRLYRKLKSGTYTFSADITSSDSGYAAIQAFVGDTSLSGNNPAIFTLSEETVVNFRFVGSNATSSTRSVEFNNIQLELASAKTSFEPYTSGTTTPVSWQDEAGTVYGGQDEVVGGELTSTMGEVDLGTLNWTYDSANARFYTIDLRNVIMLGAYGWRDWILCSSYKSAIGTNEDKVISQYASTGYIYIKDTAYADATAFKNALNGVQLVYPLATPQSFTHAPTQISTLLGQNNVWHDANGDTTVTYQASIKGYIDKVLGQ